LRFLVFLVGGNYACADFTLVVSSSDDFVSARYSSFPRSIPLCFSFVVDSLHRQLAIRAIRAANVRFGIPGLSPEQALPMQSAQAGLSAVVELVIQFLALDSSYPRPFAFPRASGARVTSLDCGHPALRRYAAGCAVRAAPAAQCLPREK
jgi:hypothetical protein